ncbi:MAG: hypothetical protein WC322_01455 [Candidatus Paceibacterota bacterium]|jgi:hypothetical protein
MFEDVILKWRGVDYPVKYNRIVGAIARVEQHLTLFELLQYTERNTIPFGRVSQAFQAALAYAGAKVTVDEIYEWMMDNPAEMVNVTECLNSLLELMVPPSLKNKSVSVSVPLDQPTVAPSLPKRTKR